MMNEDAERERIKQMREMVEHNQYSLNVLRKMLSRLEPHLPAGNASRAGRKSTGKNGRSSEK